MLLGNAVSAARPRRLGMAASVLETRHVLGIVSSALVVPQIPQAVVLGGTGSAVLVTLVRRRGGYDVTPVDGHEERGRCSRGRNPRAPAWELHPSSSPKG